MDNELSALMAQIAAAEKGEKQVDSPVRVAGRLLDVPRSGADFVSTNRNVDLHAQRAQDMQGVLNALGQFVRFTADTQVVVDPAHYQQHGPSTGVAMDARYGNGAGDWRQNEMAQRFALGLFAVMDTIRNRFTELHRNDRLNDADRAAFTQALQELQRLATGIQLVDNNIAARLQAVGIELQKMQSAQSTGSSRDLDFRRAQAVGYLAALYEERCNSQHAPEYRGKQMLGQ
ncbi:MAG TPA: hypothetical protein PKG71_01930 [Candidatus Woesebacteria bacterium]|nr:hypothetical protein [Candidatus Woesebacteria bacterium]HNS94705.1 hypothetical protein [Candidatus Woesebacteria bacterium]